MVPVAESAMDDTAGHLQSATNPESWTVSRAYRSDYKLATKRDEGQPVTCDYDNYLRVTNIYWYPDGVNEDTCQRTTIT